MISGMKSLPDTSVETEKDSGWRGSREVWLEAAKEALLESGLDSVKIQPLAAKLRLSRTSFYWFFRDRKALLETLLDAWEKKNTGAFQTACTAYSETISEAVLNLIAVFYDADYFEPQFDFAVRSWAHHSEDAAKRVNAADEARLAAIRTMFERFGFKPSEADVRARTVYLTQIGYISMQVRETMDTRLARTQDYVKVFCGRAPSKSEWARFRARIG